MSVVSWLMFFLAGIAWASVRWGLDLSVLHRRVMWVVAVALLAIPAFTGMAQHHLVQELAWPLAAGLLAADMAWDRYLKWRQRPRSGEVVVQRGRARSRDGKPGQGSQR